MRLIKLKKNKTNIKELEDIKHNNIKCFFAKSNYDKEMREFKRRIISINDEEKLEQIKNELLELKNNESRFAKYFREKYDYWSNYSLYTLYYGFGIMLGSIWIGVIASVVAKYMNVSFAEKFAEVGIYGGLGVGLGYIGYQYFKLYCNNEHKLIERKIEVVENQLHKLFIAKTPKPKKVKKRDLEATK